MKRGNHKSLGCIQPPQLRTLGPGLHGSGQLLRPAHACRDLYMVRIWDDVPTTTLHFGLEIGRVTARRDALETSAHSAALPYCTACHLTA